MQAALSTSSGQRPQSSSASRRTAAQAGFLLLIQCGERPERWGARKSLHCNGCSAGPLRGACKLALEERFIAGRGAQGGAEPGPQFRVAHSERRLNVLSG
jgi:hypothetical protein